MNINLLKIIWKICAKAKTKTSKFIRKIILKVVVCITFKLSIFLFKILFIFKAGYLLTCYLFGLGDRHYDNIMISKDGYIFNIDYGFIMGAEPKQYKGIRIAPEIKWTEDIAKALLNDENNFTRQKVFDDTCYKELMKACCKGFIILRSKTSFLMINI